MTIDDRATRARTLAAIVAAVEESARAPLFQHLDSTTAGLEATAAAPALAAAPAGRLKPVDQQ
jgi:hypothetical protein